MATDPSQLMAMLAQNSGLAGQYFQGGQDQARKQRFDDQAIALNSAKLTQMQRETDADAGFQTEWTSYLRNPSIDGLAKLAVKYPSHADAVKNFWAIKEPEARQSQLQAIAPVLNLLDNGKPAEAVTHLKRLRDAAEASKLPTDDYDQEIAALQSGDKDSINAVRGTLMMHVASIDRDGKFAETLGRVQKSFGGGEPYTLSQGQERRDGNNRVVASMAPKPDYLIVPEGGKAIPLNGAPSLGLEGGSSAPGGDPNPTGGAPRRSMGWTPRARDGGDNTDAAVDSKLAAISRATGLDIDAPLTQQQAAQVIAAIPATEGGKGSIADRNNNPGNIKFGGFARSLGATKDPNSGYAVFPTREAGMQAAQRLGKGYYARGQRTIRDIIEGKPVGQSGASAGQRSSAAMPGDPPGTVYGAPKTRNGDGAEEPIVGDPAKTGEDYLATLPITMRSQVKAIAEGRIAVPRTGTKLGSRILDAVTTYDPTFDAANAQSRVKTRIDFTSGKSANAKNALNTAMGHLLHLDSQAKGLGNFSTLPGWLNPIYNSGRQLAGDTKLPAFEQTKTAAASEMRKVFAGSAGGNLQELKDWEQTLSSSQSYEQLHEVIKNGVTLMGSRLDALKSQYADGMGRSDNVPAMINPKVAEATRKRFGIDLGGSYSPRQAARPQPPAPGTVLKGYRFNGGDPANRNSWTKIR